MVLKWPEVPGFQGKEKKGWVRGTTLRTTRVVQSLTTPILQMRK